MSNQHEDMQLAILRWVVNERDKDPGGAVILDVNKLLVVLLPAFQAILREASDVRNAVAHMIKMGLLKETGQGWIDGNLIAVDIGTWY